MTAFFLMMYYLISIKYEYIIKKSHRLNYEIFLMGEEEMIIKFTELRSKEVIHINNGDRVGFISDIDIDFETGKVISISVPGPYKALGLLGKEPDTIIKWENIKKIGDDLVIIDSI